VLEEVGKVLFSLARNADPACTYEEYLASLYRAFFTFKHSWVFNCDGRCVHLLPLQDGGIPDTWPKTVTMKTALAALGDKVDDAIGPGVMACSTDPDTRLPMEAAELGLSIDTHPAGCPHLPWPVGTHAMEAVLQPSLRTVPIRRDPVRVYSMHHLALCSHQCMNALSYID